MITIIFFLLHLKLYDPNVPTLSVYSIYVTILGQYHDCTSSKTLDKKYIEHFENDTQILSSGEAQ